MIEPIIWTLGALAVLGAIGGLIGLTQSIRQPRLPLPPGPWATPDEPEPEDEPLPPYDPCGQPTDGPADADTCNLAVRLGGYREWAVVQDTTGGPPRYALLA